MTKKTLTLKIKKSDTETDSDTAKSATKSKLSLGSASSGRRKKLTFAKKTSTTTPVEEMQNDALSEAPARSARKKRGQRIVVNPNAKRKKKVVKKVAKKVVKQQPKKKKVKEPPQKQRRPVRAVTIKPPSLTDVAAKELDERLTELYNVWCDFRPLEVGIDEAVWELITQKEWGYSKRIMRKAFKLHVRDMRYRKIVAKGGKRYNLNDEVVDDVHEFSVTYAQLHVDRKSARIIREEKLVEDIENVIAADRLKIQEAKSNRLSL
jgi:hypothetical protein